MSSIPIKNGVIAYFPEYGNQYARVDLYHIGNVYVLIGSSFHPPNPDYEGVDVDIDVTLRGNTLTKKMNGYDGWIVPIENIKFHNKELKAEAEAKEIHR